MSKMQSFHMWLFGKTDTAEPERARLAQLTQVSPDQMAAFKADLDWETWTAAEPAPAAAPASLA